MGLERKVSLSRLTVLTAVQVQDEQGERWSPTSDDRADNKSKRMRLMPFAE